ncbi:reverse transcriptase domain-containing protein [Tanacetum coccineum]
MRSPGAVASTIHSMKKFLTANEIAFTVTNKETLRECRRIEEAQGPTPKGRVTHPRIRASESKEFSEKEGTQIQEMELPKEKYPEEVESFYSSKRGVAPEAGSEGKDDPVEALEENTSPEKVIVDDDYPDQPITIGGSLSTEQDLIQDVEETLLTLKKVNMKLKPKKCSFGMEEGKFSGYIVTSEGIRANPEKTKVVMSMPSPSNLKQMQSLSGKMAALNRFLYMVSERVIPCLDTLKKCTNKNDFRWTNSVEEAFQAMKRLIAELPTLTTPMKNKELMVYLSTTEEAVSSVLLVERKGRQMPIHYVSRSLQGVELRGDKETSQVDSLVRSLWHIVRLEECDKGQVLSDFLANTVTADDPSYEKTHSSEIAKGGTYKSGPHGRVEELNELSVDVAEVNMVVEEERRMRMTPIREYMEKGILPDDPAKARTIREKTNNYVIEDGVLYWKSYLGLLLQCIGLLQANYVVREIHMGSCKMHEGPRRVVHKEMNAGYYWLSMHRDVNHEIKSCDACQAYAVVPRLPKDDIYRFGVQATIFTYNGTQLISEPFKSWAEGLEIKAISMFVYHPQLNGAAHRTMPKTSNGETLSSLAYDIEAVIPAEIRSTRKLGPKWEGPYEVIEAYKTGAYKLRSMDGNEAPRNWHSSNLRKYYM